MENSILMNLFSGFIGAMIGSIITGIISIFITNNQFRRNILVRFRDYITEYAYNPEKYRCEDFNQDRMKIENEYLVAKQYIKNKKLIKKLDEVMNSKGATFRARYDAIHQELEKEISGKILNWEINEVSDEYPD
jgi:hypothetical protein